MPHATNMPSPGFQALILCGPGVSLNTFTANPEEFPKALVPVANRPMVWYPLDWCYRMGVTNITLLTPPTSHAPLEAALLQNPHLTSLPAPKADILAPPSLEHTTPTAEILRLPEVQAAITGDFIILPCDLICELPGETLIDAWMVQQSGLGGVSHSSSLDASTKKNLGGETGGRRGGLGVWFETKGEDHVKGAETDFIITTALPAPPAPPPESSLLPHISKLLYATTTDTLRDIMEENEGFPIRPGMIRKHGKIRMLTTHRDAHIYLFPHWVMEMIRRNEKFDSISEDVVGWWAKASWQTGLAEKLQLDQVLHHESPKSKDQTSGDNNGNNNALSDVSTEIDLLSMSSTHTSTLAPPNPPSNNKTPLLPMPPMLSYIHPSSHLSQNPQKPASTTSTKPQKAAQPPPTPPPLIRRIDTSALLLSTSLRIAALPPLENPPPDNSTTTTKPTPTPHSHASKISTSPSLIAAHTTIHTPTVLIAPNTSIATHCTIKATVIGSNCVIEQGAKLMGCLLMDGVVVGEKAVLQGCILGRRCVVGRGAGLRECEVQEGFKVEDGVEGKGEKFLSFEGLEEDLEAMSVDGDGEGDGEGDDENLDQSS